MFNLDLGAKLVYIFINPPGVTKLKKCTWHTENLHMPGLLEVTKTKLDGDGHSSFRDFLNSKTSFDSVI